MMIKPKGMGRALPVLAAVLAALAVAGTASAQVAAPRLNETTPAIGAPSNPAVLPWSMSSQAGINGQTNIKREETPALTGTSTETGTGSGGGVQARLAGGSLAGGIEYSSVKLDIAPSMTLPSGGTEETKQGQIGLGGKFAGWLTVAIGYESSTLTETDLLTASTKETKSTMPVIGAAARFGDAIFVGGSYGQRKVDQTDTTTTASGDAGVGRYGVAYHMQKDMNGFHLELYRQDDTLLEVRDAADTLVIATEGNTNGVTLEVMYAGFLFGAEGQNTSTDEVTPPSVKKTIDTQARRYGVAWVPKAGFSIGVAGRSSKVTDTSSNDVTKDTVTEVAIAWIW